MMSFQPNMKLILEAHECPILINDNRLDRDTFLLNRSERHCNVTNTLSAGSVKLGAERLFNSAHSPLQSQLLTW